MPPPIRTLVEDYRERMQRFGGLSLVEVAEEKRISQKKADREKALVKEAKRIGDKLPERVWTIPLDSRGKSYSSEQFAKRVESWREERGEVCFVIGGPDGIQRELQARLGPPLSFGPMTLPHMLARVVLLEQLYRAMTILHHVPYHR
ncbi:MAG: 23S rRNA (pseudouridine(1915)-N(3))-methyltransferase RlmH [Magnetococcales bacterium]|nr:23S rRNA (pseudouridine(1915)-N(3))-methyltransferase RlmH [Magnetococcales bacterium]